MHFYHYYKCFLVYSLQFNTVILHCFFLELKTVEHCYRKQMLPYLQTYIFLITESIFLLLQQYYSKTSLCSKMKWKTRAGNIIAVKETTATLVVVVAFSYLLPSSRKKWASSISSLKQKVRKIIYNKICPFVPSQNDITSGFIEI